MVPWHFPSSSRCASLVRQSKRYEVQATKVSPGWTTFCWTGNHHHIAWVQHLFPKIAIVCHWRKAVIERIMKNRPVCLSSTSSPHSRPLVQSSSPGHFVRICIYGAATCGGSLLVCQRHTSDLAPWPAYTGLHKTWKSQLESKMGLERIIFWESLAATKSII